METMVTRDGEKHPCHESEVMITVDGNSKRVHPGRYIVAKFKVLVGVDSCRDLDEVICGEFRPLDDAAEVVIKGCQVFVSHVRCGGSS